MESLKIKKISMKEIFSYLIVLSIGIGWVGTRIVL